MPTPSGASRVEWRSNTQETRTSRERGSRSSHLVSSLTRTRAGGKNYSFKCHRYDVPTGSMPGTPAQTGSQHVFGVNEIAFHKTEGTFCTGGSDGSITFWDGVARTKLKGGSSPVGSS